MKLYMEYITPLILNNTNPITSAVGIETKLSIPPVFTFLVPTIVPTSEITPANKA
ncbi:unnamed protein product, partial [marine sediment metagenome]